jgi:predicted small secreted protein
MLRLIAFLLASFAVLGATACNTVKGAGQDLESASDSVKTATH